MNRKGYETLILIVYFAMLAICVFFNMSGKGQAAGTGNLIVNAAMFLIVGVVFVVCITGSLWPTGDITWDLKRAVSKIEDDAKHTHKFLWDKYKEEKEEIFKTRLLSRRYQDYKYELERIELSDKTYYKCDISDYIGPELTDSVIHREQLSQVPGVMTGLGILGTFIGLSLGLQSFNTGTTAEITNSIEPLMDGIKVAFHTSIYGMVFSLVFNYVYRKRLNEADDSVRDFISAYRKYVMPDTSAEGVNRLLELERQQTEAVRLLSDTMIHSFPDRLKTILEPEFDRFNNTITDFTNMATRNQIEQMSKVVELFISELNKSLGRMFSDLSDTIDKTMVLQGENEKQIQEIFNRNLGVADNMSAVAAQTRGAVASIRQYVDEIQVMEETVSKELELLKKQSDRTELMADAFPREVEQTFKVINENLRSVETHFRDSVVEINGTLEKVPETVDYSYRGVEKAVRDLSKAVEDFTYSVRELEEQYRKRR